jgi:hypothetical protein
MTRFHSRARSSNRRQLCGAKSYLVNLGDPGVQLAGDPRRCSAAGRHQLQYLPYQRRSNPKLHILGLSTRPGTFDTTSGLFNKADNHVLYPVTIPSLRGTRYLAPYGHDGRIAS